MARLPTVGGDSGNWGSVLNEYLRTSHNTDGTLKLDVKTIADLKAIDVTTLTDKQQALVAGYYAPGDGGGGAFYYDVAASDADNGGTIIAPTAGAGRWLRAYSGAINVRWFGAKADGTTDDTTAIAAALATSGPKALFLPAGKYRITSALNLTDRLGPYTIIGEGRTHDGIGTIIYAETGGVAIDCTGSSFTTISNLSIISYGRSNPSTVGVLVARSTTAGREYAQFNKLEDVLIWLAYDITTNGGNGTVAYYNNAAEQNCVENVFFKADNPLVFCGTNLFNITSTYVTTNNSITSCSVLTVDGSTSTLACRNDTRAPALLNGAYAVTFNNTYFQGTGFAGANNRALVAINSHKIHVNGGNTEEMNSVAYLENCSDVVLNAACNATSYAPIEIGAGKYVNRLVFSPFIVTGPYTNWPRFINAGAGATHNDTHIHVPGDDGTVSGTNCTDFRGYFRSVKGSATGQGGYFNLHLPGNPVIEQACTFTAIAAGGRPNNSLFLDSADGILKFKDSGGVVHALW